MLQKLKLIRRILGILVVNKCFKYLVLKMVVVVVIGMPICEAFAQIEQQPNIYDVVHVKYFDEVWFRELHAYFVIFQKFNCCYI